jgi:hypothetical protein
MSYYNNDDKPKNDFEKPKFTPYEPGDYPRERGGCLTAFLVFVIGVNVFFLFTFCVRASELSRYSNSSSVIPILAVSFAVQGAVLACAVAMWNWKSWGYYGLGAAYAIQAVLMLLSGNILGLVGSLIGLGILYAVVNPRVEMFE